MRNKLNGKLFYFKYSFINYLRKIFRVFLEKVENNFFIKIRGFLSDVSKWRVGGGNEDNYNYFIFDGNEMKEKRKLRISGKELFMFKKWWYIFFFFIEIVSRKYKLWKIFY